MGSRYDRHWDSRRMVLFGSHGGYLLAMSRWMGHEQGARRRIENQSGRNGAHATQERRLVWCITRIEEGEYSSQGYLAVLKEAEVQVSMSRKGDCYDNALMESFFGTVKEECVERQTYQTRAEARNAVFEYIEVCYNRQRRHSSLGYVSPVTYEQMRGGAEL